jgi:hypothetical protein
MEEQYIQHIAQVNINPDHWTQYSGWFYVKNYGPNKDYRVDLNEGILVLLHSTIINDFFAHHPNLDYSTVHHSEL